LVRLGCVVRLCLIGKTGLCGKAVSNW